MFESWVAHGAEIGTVAFFALAMFGLLCAVILALYAIIAKFLRENDDENEKPNRPRPV